MSSISRNANSSFIGLEKSLDAIFVVQGLEVVVPTNMLLIDEDTWHSPLVCQLREVSLNIRAVITEIQLQNLDV